MSGVNMEYLALYRKYRPTSFSKMVGQNEIRKILTTAVENRKITHAYLFSGPRGTGKTTTAKILAKMVNCENIKNGEPCCQCNSCINILNSNDIIEIDAASNNGVDEIRNLREKATLVPSMCKYKVYIIDEVHMLTTQAFNALLKILEEPPKHVIFILATTEYHKIPLTILSRCQKFQFNKLTVDEIVVKLREIANLEKIDISDDALFEIAKISDGGMRDSINFLDQVTSIKVDGKIDINDVYEVCGNISSKNISNLFEYIINDSADNVVNFFEEGDRCGKNFNKLFEDIISFLTNMLLYKKNVSLNFIHDDIKCISQIANLYSMEQIYYMIDEINLLIDRLKYISRQKVLIISSFLLIQKNINAKLDINNDEISKKDKVEDKTSKYELAFDFTKNDVVKSNEVVKKNIDSDEKREDRFEIKNKNILINNTLAVASKKYKNDLQKKYSNVSVYLTDKKYGDVASLFVDIVLQVAGEGYVMFTAKYLELVDKFYLNYDMCKKFIDMLFDGNYYIVVLTIDEWSVLKNKYIKDIKSGKEYEIKSLVVEEQVKHNNQNVESTIVDKLFSLVGEDCVELK